MPGSRSITRSVALGFALQIAVLAGLMLLGVSQLREIEVHHRRAERESAELARAMSVLASVRGAAVENSFYVSTGDSSRIRIRDSLVAASRGGLAELLAHADTQPERDAWTEAARQLAVWGPLLERVATAAARGPAETSRRIREQALPARLRLEAAMRTGFAIAQAEQAAALVGRDEASRMAYVVFLGGGLLMFLGAAVTGVMFTRHIRTGMAERLAASRALRESEERYRHLFDNMSEGVAWCRLVENGGTVVDFEYVAVNHAYERITGLANVVGRTASEVIPRIHETNPELLRQFAHVALTGEATQTESLVPQLGRRLHRSIYRMDQHHVVSVFEDVTAQYESRVALEQSEARFREIADHISQVFFTTESSGRCLYVSPAYEAVWGRPVATAYAEPWSWMEGIHPEDAAGLKASVMRAAPRDGGQRLHDFRVVRPDGSMRWLRSRAWVVLQDGGTPTRIVGYAEDITELRETERRLIHAQKMEAVGRLAGGVAHDFNNVLTVIQGSAQMLLEDLPKGDARRADAEQITSSVRRASALTRQLLAFSRQQVLQPTVLDPASEIAGMERMLRRLIGEDIDLVLDLRSTPARVRVDGGQLEQVLLNLVVNARDAMPRGGQLTIECARYEMDEEGAALHDLPGAGGYVAIAVTDSGTGMSPEVRDRVFEPFFTTKEPGRGTGLGLATVFGIVKQSGGHITLYTEPGRGTTFRIYLPALDDAALTVTGEHPIPIAAEPGHIGQTILVAEDDEHVRRVAAGILGRAGYTVVLASHGADALARAEAHGYLIDLVISDVVMPVMDGPTLVSRLRERHPGIRALFTSGYAGDAIARRGIMTSGTPFLEKPYTSTTLLHKVREVLDG